MTFYQLKYLSEAAHCGSISKAAESLHISQPTLSESIRDLESEFSIQIFLRSNKGIVLTQEGRDFLTYSRQILSNVENMRARFFSRVVSDKLRISTSKIPFVNKAFLDLSREFEGIGEQGSLSFTEKLTPYVVEDVTTGKSDIGIILVESSVDDIWKSYMKGLSIEYSHLVETAPVIAMREGHPLRDKATITEADIRAYPVIYTYETEDCFPNNNEGYYSYDLKRFPKLIYIRNQSTVYDMIASSNAVCIISCPNGLSALGHNYFTIPYSSSNCWNAYWIRRKQHKMSELELHFIELLKENMLLS